jgi:Glycosyltransferase family 87
MLTTTSQEGRRTDGSIAAPTSSPYRWRLSRSPRIGLIVFLLICTLANARQAARYWSQGPADSDLKIFLTGLEVMKSEQRQHFYSFEVHQEVQNRLYPETRQTGYLAFNHLAYELLLYWPLAWFTFSTAQKVWGLLNLGLVLLIAWFLNPFTKELRGSLRIPLVLWLLAFYPVLFVLGQGQDSLIFLSLVVLSLRFAASEREYPAGFLLGLALFKVHLALSIGFFVFVLSRKWRAVAGFASSAILVTGISRLMVGPRFVGDYLSLLRRQEVMTPWGFIPWYMPNLRGLLQWSLARWMDVGSILPLILILSLAVLGATWLALRARRVAAARELYSTAILATLLVSYHMHIQDLSLAILSMLILLDACVSGKLAQKWTWAAILSIGTLYLYGAAVWPFPILAVRGALLTLPVMLLWMVAIGNSINGAVPQANVSPE